MALRVWHRVRALLDSAEQRMGLRVAIDGIDSGGRGYLVPLSEVEKPGSPRT